MKILEKHDKTKILFATDSPWSDAASGIQEVKKLPFEKTLIEDILYGNAKKMLNM